MKLDFDPRKNITKLDYLMTPFKTAGRMISNLLVIHSIVKNWPDVLMFRLGLKKANFIMELRNGLKIIINKPKYYFEFWGTEEGQITLLNLQNFKEKHSEKIVITSFLSTSSHLYCSSINCSFIKPILSANNLLEP